MQQICSRNIYEQKVGEKKGKKKKKDKAEAVFILSIWEVMAQGKDLEETPCQALLDIFQELHQLRRQLSAHLGKAFFPSSSLVELQRGTCSVILVLFNLISL